MTSKRWVRGFLMVAAVAGFAMVASRSVRVAHAAEARVEPSRGTAAARPALQAQLQPARAEVTVSAAPSVETAAALSTPAPRKPVPYTQPGEPPANLRRLTAAEVPVPMRTGLYGILSEHRAAKVGALIPTTFEGKTYIARIEIHYHPEGGPVRPWGNHRGISLFVERQ